MGVITDLGFELSHVLCFDLWIDIDLKIFLCIFLF